MAVAMLAVSTFLKRLFPEGTKPKAQGMEEKWIEFPVWPPDLYAAAASLLDRSGCYSHPRFSGGGWAEPFQGGDYISIIQKTAIEWNRLALQEQGSANDALMAMAFPHMVKVKDAWRRLITCELPIEPCGSDMQPPSWCDDAMFLLSVADEASMGIGFFIGEEDLNVHRTPFIEYWMDQYLIKDLVLSVKAVLSQGITKLEGKEMLNLKSTLDIAFSVSGKDFSSSFDDLNDLLSLLCEEVRLPYLTNSLCQLVPSSELCVQPKTRTSNVGCTIRSLSHHLSLLPAISMVETFWRVPHKPFQDSHEGGPQALNLLLVPFPYSVKGSCFVRGNACTGSNPKDWDDETDNRARFFSVDQSWLMCANDPTRRVSETMFADFLCDIIEESKNEVDEIHGIILPELSLDSALASGVSKILSERTKLEFFIAGVLAEGLPNRGPKNCVFTSVFSFSPEAARSWKQAKHHRWKLEKHQIRRYHLGGQLDPHLDWWEGIDISPRECYFGVFRHEACLTALVCEDLARVDPVQSIIRSVAPNLVVALLMDGPQLESRWPGRYATVLAEDPGVRGSYYYLSRTVQTIS